MPNALTIRGFAVSVQETPILKGVNLTVEPGKIHALMGPNGSGKSTLSYALLGHPAYTVTGGSVTWQGKDLLGLSPDQRAQAGLFLAFQYPQEIPGVSLAHFLRAALNNVRAARQEKELSVIEFRRLLKAKMELLQMREEFAERYLNDGFSGGEKKRAEMLQMALLEPSIAILDETDSGLDIDALRTVSEGINTIKKLNPTMGVLLITHYQRILNYVKADEVHVMVAGKIVESGGPELVGKLESEGYAWLTEAEPAPDGGAQKDTAAKAAAPAKKKTAAPAGRGQKTAA